MEENILNTPGKPFPNHSVPFCSDPDFSNLWTRSLQDWLREVDAEKFDLVGAITRRAFNTIWLFMLQMPELTNLRACFTSDNGLYAESEKIARFYAQHGRFPRIAILDDILIYGRNLNQFLSGFQVLVFDCLKNIGSKTDKEQDAIEEDFYQSITLWVLVANKASFSLKPEYQRRFRYQKICPESQWRKYSVLIAQFIEKENIVNTSYVISAYSQDASQPEAAAEVPGWICFRQEGNREGGIQQTFYCLSVDGTPGIYPTVRSYVKAGRRYFVPYMFCEDLTSSQVVQVLQDLFDRIPSQAPAHKLVGFFNRIAKYPQRLHVYCQLFYLVLSQVTLSVFLSEHPHHFTIDGYDCQKIARNFTFSPNLEKWLDSLVEISWTREQLLELIQPLQKTAGNGSVIHSSAALMAEEQKELQPDIEYSVYEQALVHELHGKMLLNNNAPNTRERTGEQPVTEFLQKLSAPADNAVRNAGILSVLTMLMDQGAAALKARVRLGADNKLIFYSSVRNTELSLSILPRRIQKHYDEFYRVAQFYWRDDDFPKRVERYFVTIHGYSPSDRFVKDAVKFAELIGRYRDIVDSMLNWRSVYGRNSFQHDATESDRT